jgi:transcriptional regulator with XRE-family HTH domain
MKDLKTLGDRLRYARRLVGISQEKLANAIDVTQGVVSKIERGDQPTSTHINEFARILNCDAYWLSSGKGGFKICAEAESSDIKYIKNHFDLLSKNQRQRYMDSLRETVKLNQLNSDI